MKETFPHSSKSSEIIPENFPLDMYRFPGQEKGIAERWYKKYQEAQEKFDRMKSDIIKQALSDGDLYARLQSIYLTKGIDDETFRKEIITRALQDSDQDVRLQAINLATDIDDEVLQQQVKETIIQALQGGDWYVQRQAIDFAKGIDDKILQQQIKETITQALQDSDWGVRLKAIELAIGIDDQVLQQQVKETITQALKDDNWYVRLQAINLAKGIDDEVLQQQVKEITRNHFKEYDVTSTEALYNNSKDSRGFGGRLNKTGSETILIDTAPGFEGKSFKGKIIIREIQIGPFLAWKKAYENHEAWKEAGYDYVPIEPILYFSVNKDMTVRVYTGVLDKDVDSLGLDQDKRLEETLEKIGVHHGHLKNKNVCTLFPRDAAGKIIIDGTMPRQYIIDFDMAHL